MALIDPIRFKCVIHMGIAGEIADKIKSQEKRPLKKVAVAAPGSPEIDLGSSSAIQKSPFLINSAHLLQATALELSAILQKESRSEYEKWINTLGLETHETAEKIEETTANALGYQATYLFFSKIFSYHVIRVQFRNQFSISISSILEPKIKGASSLYDQISSRFKELIELYEFAPLFGDSHEAQSLFNRLYRVNSIEPYITDFIHMLHEDGDALVDFSRDFADSTSIALIYQALIPPAQRKQLGQIYTPVEIADFMATLAIRGQKVTVFDPACGCGTLMHQAYLRLRQLALDSGQTPTHLELLEHIWGVELNQFPAHLAMMTLALLDPSAITRVAGVLTEDFLAMGPLKKYFVRTKDLITGQTITREMPAKFDVVIANPPYIKQEKIPNKAEMMKRLPEFAAYRQLVSPNSVEGQKLQKLSSKIKLELTGKADYYAFFIWYSTYFLKDQGTLCYIVPNKWLDVKYGEELKSFLINHFKITAVIGFGRNQFKDAQVSTIILLAIKEENPDKRRENIVRFIQLEDFDHWPDLLPIVYSGPDSQLHNKLISEGYSFIKMNEKRAYQCTNVLQASLDVEEKWSFKYLLQSECIRRLVHAPVISMDNRTVTKVLGGIKTGANAFYFPTPADIAHYKIESIFLKPGIKSGRNIPAPLHLNTPPDYFLAIPPETNLKNYQGIATFIRDCEEKHKYHERPSVNWKPWYSIPTESQDRPDIIFLRHIDSQMRVKWNKVGCIVADGVRGLQILDPNDTKFYLGVCNSLFFYWQAHVCGRWEGQGDLQLLVYELRRFQIPDIRQVTKSKVQAVEKVIDAIVLAQNKLKNFERDDPLQKALDLAVLDCMGMADIYGVMLRETEEMEYLRLNKKV